MSWKTTIVLAGSLAILLLILYLSERRIGVRQISSISQNRLFAIQPSDVLGVSVSSDFWNSFKLNRNAGGEWELVEPSRESASRDAVEQLLTALTNMTVLSTIDSPSDDSERYQQYGLWNPARTILITTPERDYTAVFGAATPDGKGIYATKQDDDKVYIIHAERYYQIPDQLDDYRQANLREAGNTQ